MCTQLQVRRASRTIGATFHSQLALSGKQIFVLLMNLKLTSRPAFIRPHDMLFTCYLTTDCPRLPVSDHVDADVDVNINFELGLGGDADSLQSAVPNLGHHQSSSSGLQRRSVARSLARGVLCHPSPLRILSSCISHGPSGLNTISKSAYFNFNLTFSLCVYVHRNILQYNCVILGVFARRSGVVFASVQVLQATTVSID